MNQTTNKKWNLFSIIICGFIAFWPFSQMSTISLGSGVPDVSIERILLPVLFILFAFKKISVEKKISFNHFFFSFVLFFIVLMLNITFLSESKIIVIRLIFDIYFIGFLTYFSIVGFKESIHVKLMVYACLICGVIISSVGIFEYFYGQNIIGPVNASYEEAKYFRTNGPFNDIIGYGAILLLYIVAVYQFMVSKVLTKKLAIPCIMFFSLGIFLTFSRADIFVLIFIWAMMLGGKSSIRIFFILLSIALLAICLYFAWDVISTSTVLQDRMDTKTMTGRWAMYTYALNFYLEKPFFGIGFENFLTIKKHHYVVHNSYLQMLLELGLVGFVFFMYYVVSIINLIQPRKIQDSALKHTTMKSKICIASIILFIPNTVNLLHNAQFMQAAMIIFAALYIQTDQPLIKSSSCTKVTQ